MSATKSKWIKWQHVAGISLICGLAVTGCDRSDKDDSAETIDATAEQSEVDDNVITPAVSCDDPMVQDRLKSALKNMLNQQAQTLAANYANEAEISLNSGVVTDKVNGIVIDVQNAAILQEANNNGITTCQASVSMTLPSEDLYQASQVQAAGNQPSLQSRLAQNNIRINNNMLVDDAFTYVVGTQGGQVRTRIAGQPALLTVVSDVMAGSVFKSAVDERRAQRAAQQAERRRDAAQNESNNQSAPTRQPRAVTPTAPVRPAEPATPPTINNPSSSQNNSQSSATENNQAAAPSTDAQKPATQTSPKLVPNDESIDMVIIEDESATY